MSMPRTDLMEVWTPISFPGVEIANLVFDYCYPRGFTATEEDVVYVHRHEFETNRDIYVVACSSTVAHTDNDFPKWQALLILGCEDGHKIGMLDGEAEDQEHGVELENLPPGPPDALIAPEIGQIVLFNAHRLHWVTKGIDGGSFTAVCAEFEERPTRAAVEAAFQKTLRPALSGEDVVATTGIF